MKAHALNYRKKEREEEKRENTPQWGRVISNPLSLVVFPIRILGTHAHTFSVFFKPPGPGLELHSARWDPDSLNNYATELALKKLFLYQNKLVL